MSGATWRSRAPSVGGATPPQPNQKTCAHRASVVLLSPSVFFARWRCARRTNAPSKAHEAARKARKDRLERAWIVSVEGPDEPHSRSARNENGAEFSGADVEVVSLRCHARSALCSMK